MLEDRGRQLVAVCFFQDPLGFALTYLEGRRDSRRQFEKLVAQETVDADEFEKFFTDLPPKSSDHGVPTVVGPAQPIPEPNPQPA